VRQGERLASHDGHPLGTTTAQQAPGLLPPAGADVTLQKEIHSRARTFPEASEGWTISLNGKSLLEAQVGKRKPACLRTQMPELGKPAQFIRWFTDGERRYGKALWKPASVYLKQEKASALPSSQGVARGFEVAMKIKGSRAKTD